MDFTGNRLELLEMAKKVTRLANEHSPIEALRGVYLESDEDAGEVSMLTTDYAAAILLKEKASVARSGRLVINAKMLVGMLTLLSGENVQIMSENSRKVRISSGSSVYNFVCLSGEHYPKPTMPFPEDAVKLTGICSLAKKTVFATSKEESKPALQCICLKVKQNSAHAAATDGVRMMLARGEAESSGTKEFLLPAASFLALASISTDEDAFDVGVVGNEVVFTKKNMLFSIKQHSGSFIDTNEIIKSIKPAYTALVSASELRMALDLVSVGAGTQPVNLSFTGSAVKLSCDGDAGASSSETEAAITGDMPKDGFLYNVSYLLKLFQVMSGKVKLEIDAKGFMIVRSKSEVYLQLPMRNHAAANKTKKKEAA